MAILVKTNDTKGEVVHPQNGNVFTLEELQSYVGGYIELAPLVKGKDATVSKMFIVVDEEGRLKNKPFNKYASLFANQFLVGDVLFCKRNEIE